jgi:CheY-like chemotaxis protein
VSMSRVLLVEDEQLIRLFLVEALNDAGYQVVEVATGDDASKELDGPDVFELLMTDVHMPGRLDGIAVARKARQKYPDIAVIYMTGRPDVLQRAGPVGPHEAVLVKPYAPSLVLETVARLLGTSHSASRIG